MLPVNQVHSFVMTGRRDSMAQESLPLKPLPSPIVWGAILGDVKGRHEARVEM